MARYGTLFFSPACVGASLGPAPRWILRADQQLWAALLGLFIRVYSCRFAVPFFPFLFHPIKRLLQNLDITGVIKLGSSGFDPLLFQRILGRTIDLIEHPKKTGER